MFYNRQIKQHPIRPELTSFLSHVSQKCNQCNNCQNACEFLKNNGSPKTIADTYDPSYSRSLNMAFECNLCGLCAVVCPLDIDPCAMFLEMRREASTRQIRTVPEHKAILGYEKRGTSPLLTYYAFPKECDTVFFPGCTFPGTRPETTVNVYNHLKKNEPSLGIVLDCCSKPSHDLGRISGFKSIFNEMMHYLAAVGVRHIIVACPNCYKIFKTYGNNFSVKTVYEILSGIEGPNLNSISDRSEVTIHDPCVLRFETSIQEDVRELIQQKGLTISEMKHSGRHTLCCGEGGAAGCLIPEYASAWGRLRKKEADGRRIVTYCAGCTNALNAFTATDHILDILFAPEKETARRNKIVRAPFTYWNRIRLKRKLKKYPAEKVRERSL